jgi:perosamine synthetase
MPPKFPKHPTFSYPHLFRKRRHCLRNHHSPGTLHHTFNGRGALFQLLSRLPEKTGGTLLLPAYHCPAVVKPVISAGYRVEYYRIRPDLTIDSGDLAARLRPDTAAVVVIHYFGFPADLGGILPHLRNRGIPLIEDCTHSFLSRDGNDYIGRRGDYAIFSYYKLTPGLSGGSFVANKAAPHSGIAGKSPPLSAHCTILRQLIRQGAANSPHPRARRVSRRFATLLQPLEDAGVFDDIYRFDEDLARWTSPWYARRIIEASHWEEVARARRRNYELHSRLIPDSPTLRRALPGLPEGVVPFVFPLIFPDRLRHQQALKDLGVPRMFFGETFHESFAAVSGDTRQDAEFLSNTLMLLPVHQDLDAAQIEAYVALLLDYVARLPVHD